MSGQRVFHSTQNMVGHVTRLERPLPPGEGWGEGPLLSDRLPLAGPFSSTKSCRRRWTRPLQAQESDNSWNRRFLAERTSAVVNDEPLTPTLSRRERAFEPRDMSEHVLRLVDCALSTDSLPLRLQQSAQFR